jgi:uncharacterized protein YbjQ (UPF0145 family)
MGWGQRRQDGTGQRLRQAPTARRCMRRARTNAVIGVCYDATEIMGGVTEVLCYGTAVVVEPV